jgi:hypothetical protein
MEHTDAAQVAALVGALGAALALLARSLVVLVAGLATVVGAGIGLAVSVTGGSALDRVGLLQLGAAGLAATVSLGAGAFVLVRWPGGIVPVLVAVAPFRPPIDLGADNRFLVSIATDGRIGRLLPLYGVLAVAVLATGVRAVRSGVVAPLPREIAFPAALLVGLTCISLTWSHDVRAGSDLLLFFVLPLATILAVGGRAPVRPWLARVLFIEVVAISGLLAAVGLWEAYAEESIFATARVEVGNVYQDFFRVTSLFNDPSLYGRHLVVGIAVVLVALLARRVNAVLAGAMIAFLFAGLYFSYSQSSMIALGVTTLAVALVMGDRRSRQILVAGTVALALLGGTAVAASVQDESIGRITSDRSRRVNLTAEVFALHPVVGVGVGGHPQATSEIAPRPRPKEDFVSHTTPLTVAAELGLVGLAAFGLFLGGAAVALVRVTRVDRAFGLGLGAVLLGIFVHSLFYGGFLEDPITWLVLGVASAVLASAAASRTTVEAAT